MNEDKMKYYNHRDCGMLLRESNGEFRMGRKEIETTMKKRFERQKRQHKNQRQTTTSPQTPIFVGIVNSLSLDIISLSNMLLEA